MKAGEEKSRLSDRTRTYWTPPMDRHFIDFLLDQVDRGNKLGQTFISQAWIDMVMSFNAKFSSQYDKDVLKNRYKHLRRLYNEIKFLLEQNGFWWDEIREMITAKDNVWDAYIKVHPEARSYKVKTVPSYLVSNSSLIDAVRAVGEQLIAANPVELAVGNIVRRVLHIIREEDLSLTTDAIDGLNLSSAAVAAAASSNLRPPSLLTLLEDVPVAAAVPHSASSGGDSEAVTATGIIWSRYSTVITPKNWNLFSVNVAMAGTGIYQLSRKIKQGYFSEEETAVVTK